MGSSVRKTSIKIKHLLQETLETNADVTIDEVMPRVAVQSIRAKKTKNYFGSDDFTKLVTGGISLFTHVRSTGFTSFIEEYAANPNRLTKIDIQNIIESILNVIEEENGDIESTLILAAFQNAVTEMLINENVEPRDFLMYLCRVLIKMAIREDALENIMAEFKTLSNSQIDATIDAFTEKFVQEHLIDIINRFSEGVIDAEQFIKEIIKELK